jgi:poly-gamma-glutamate capsule biosynthesis protein CapA/YwtB (metallophosphatase superfamily)
LEVFNLDVVYVCNDFQVFLDVFASVFKRLFQVFHMPSFCMLQQLYLDVLRVDRGVAHEMRMGSDRRRSGRRKPTAGVLARKLDTLDAHSLPVWVASGR